MSPSARTDDRPPLAVAHDLAAHPEGGWYRRTWATGVSVAAGPQGQHVRPSATSVLFALHTGESSAWHAVSSDEVWFWHGPGVVTLELGGRDEAPAPGRRVVLGPGVAAGEQLQVLVPAGTWQRTLPAERDTLVSCVVSPGFDFADFRLAT